MATYNWRYKGGSVIVVDNITTFTVAASADDVKPANAVYIALWGNDITGNGSRMKPYKTLAKTSTSNQITIIGSGVYRLGTVNHSIQNFTVWIGDGNVTIDGYTGIVNLNSVGGNGIIKDITLKNLTSNSNQIVGCILQDCLVFSNYCILTRSVFINTHIRGLAIKHLENTYIRCYLQVSEGTVTICRSCIHYQCNIDLTLNGVITHPTIDFHLFYQCNFRAVTSNVILYSILFYPNTPTGYTQLLTIEDLRTYLNTIYTTSPGMLPRCIVADPKFNNPDIGDYSLAFDSPAKKLSYFGTYVGAKSIGYPIKASSTETSGDFDFSTAVNVTVANNSITMTNPALTSIIETNCKVNLIQRAFSKVSVQGFNADRNGQYIDSIKDLASTTTSAGTNLVANTPYIVEAASITYNGAVILAGERFTTTSVLSFTSAGGGVCREITEAPQRHTIEARFSDGGATKNVGDTLTVGYWYYVSGTITYNGVDYTNRTFKAVDTNSFTGAGILMEALTTQAYQHYEIGIPFTSNNVGDARTGAIVRGNGDPAYERGTTKEFPINARFVQIKFTIQPNNLKP